MPESPQPVYFDACLFIELLQQGNQERFDACEDLRVKAVSKALIIVTSAITITEVNKLPESGSLAEERRVQEVKSTAYSLALLVRRLRPFSDPSFQRRLVEPQHALRDRHGRQPSLPRHPDDGFSRKPETRGYLVGCQ